MSSENPHKNHRQRIRDRFVQTGLNGFADHEALEFLLFYAIPRKDTNKLAHKMIDAFGSLHNLLDASVEEIMDACDVSENTACLVSMMPDLARKYKLSKQGEKVFITSSQEAGLYCVDLFLGQNTENFYLLCLNAQNQIIQTVLLQEGTIDQVHFYSRDIVKISLRYHAVSIIAAHNHPGGTLKASQQDMIATKDMRDVLATIDVDLLDHIIVSGNQYYSLAEQNFFHLNKEYT